MRRRPRRRSAVLALEFRATLLVVCPAVFPFGESASLLAMILGGVDTERVFGSNGAEPGLCNAMLTACFNRGPLKLADMNVGESDKLAAGLNRSGQISGDELSPGDWASR